MADGDLDTSFVDPVFEDVVRTVVLQPDGKVLAGGIFDTVGGVAIPRIARLNADGTRDTSFASPGINFGTVFAITPQPDGKVLVGGSFSTAGGVASQNAARLNAAGTLHTTLVATAFSSYVPASPLQPHGKVTRRGT